VSQIDDPKDSLHQAIVFDVADWSVTSRMTWVYGIIVGWDRDSLDEFKQKFQWSEESCQWLIRLHEKFKNLE